VTLTLNDLYEEDGFVAFTYDGDLVLYKDDEGSVYCSDCATESREFIVDFDDAVFFADCELCGDVIKKEEGNITWLQT
jgi:hypothetical protein